MAHEGSPLCRPANITKVRDYMRRSSGCVLARNLLLLEKGGKCFAWFLDNQVGILTGSARLHNQVGACSQQWHHCLVGVALNGSWMAQEQQPVYVAL